MPLGDTLTESSILAEKAKALVPLLDAEAEFADTEGELSPTAVEALHRDGLFKIWVPEKLGGAELDPVHSLEVLENLSYADASTGWVAMAANLSIGTAGAYLSDHAVAELWDDGKNPVIAGQGTRPGTATIADGGLSLSGSWSFGSGLKHSTHVHSLGIIRETGEPRIFVTPIGSRTIDNWDVVARAARQHRSSMDNVFVPTAEPLPSPPRPSAVAACTAGDHRLRCHLPQRLGEGVRRLLDELAALVGKADDPAHKPTARHSNRICGAEAVPRCSPAESFTDLTRSPYAGDGFRSPAHRPRALPTSPRRCTRSPACLLVRWHHIAAPRHDPTLLPRRARRHAARHVGPGSLADVRSRTDGRRRGQAVAVPRSRGSSLIPPRRSSSRKTPVRIGQNATWPQCWHPTERARQSEQLRPSRAFWQQSSASSSTSTIGPTATGRQP